MDYSLITENSPLWIIPILLFALGMSWWQYRPASISRDYTKRQVYILAGIRFLVYTCILFLLLNPLVKFNHRQEQKPLLIWAQDNSQSLFLNEDSTYLKTEYQRDFLSFEEKLKDEFDFRVLKFGNGVQAVDTFDYKDKFTDFSELFKRLGKDFPPGATGAVVLASDGAFNKGNHPRYALNDISFPVYTVTLGDTTTISDVAISALRFNRIAFFNQPVPIQLNISARNFNQQSIQVRVMHRGNTVFRNRVEVSGNVFHKELNFFITPEKSGLQNYEVELLPVRGEFTARNNSRRMVIDVLDSRRKILLLYEYFHPDMGSLKSAIETDQNFELVYKKVSQSIDSLSQYDLAVLYQLPGTKSEATQWINELKRQKVPMLLVVGASTNVENLNSFGLGLSIKSIDNQYEEVQGKWNSRFSLFDMEELEQEIIGTFPPLLAPFGKVEITRKADVVMTQRIKAIDTPAPLVLFTELEEQKIGWILGEGLWRWKLNNYLTEQNHQVFESFLNRIVQYLSLKEKKDRIVVQMKRSYSEVENIEAEVQLYNDSYELFNEPEMELELIDDEFKKYSFTFSRTNRAYRVNIGNIPVGEYKYTIRTQLSDKVFERSGAFVVVAEDMESIGIPANHQVLFQLAQLSGGKSYSSFQLDNLEKDLKDNAELKPVVFYESYFDNVLEYSVLGILFLMLMTLEWFLKRFWGGY